MRCLCCGKPITGNAQGQWHSACIRRFFGTFTLPEVDISQKTLTRIAAESINKGFTVPGVQKKMSLHLTTDEGKPRLTLVNYPTGYILKPQTELYEALPEAEFLVMQMAEATGIATVPFALIQTGDERAYITKRIDRILPSRKQPMLTMLAMEDFCQLDQRLTEDKYRSSYERCAKIVTRYSQRPGLDLSEFFMRVVFSFAVGNSDMHLKNFSMIETEAGSQRYILSSSYDMLPVNVIVPEDAEQMALPLNGKKRNLHGNDFLELADVGGIARGAAEKMIRKIISMREKYHELCAESYLPVHLKNRLDVLIDARLDALG